MKTVDEYKKAIKAKYEMEKWGDYTEYFINPSPAKFKKLCALLFEINANPVDEGIFSKFFDFKMEEEKSKQIKKFDADKFRPFQNFLIRNTELSSIESLNLLAVLVDFHPRPYTQFRHRDFDVNQNEETDKEAKESLMIAQENTLETGASVMEGSEPLKRFSTGKKVILGLSALLMTVSSGYGLKSIYFPNKDCMVWVHNHYEAATFETLGFTKDVKPINQDVLEHFKKIKICDTTTFFQNGDKNKPLIWYGKSQNKKDCEYFNQPGIHPVTGKTLKPITPYIINKYILKK